MATFKILREIEGTEIIAVRHSIRELRTLRRKYGGRRWRKLKGITTVERADGAIYRVELHWYEAHGIGRRDFKVKRWLQRL